ncbi:MAG TPA: hypothetical protein VEC38_04470 [Candidatus Binataceae bacterium]|nr:hypothetical protein [Candidatus Binataceae bacterium]
MIYHEPARSARPWVPAAATALAALSLYLALRPPLYDIDGFPDRLAALEPEAIYDILPNHLVWRPLLMALVTVSSWFGYSDTVPLQLFGILINCAVLFFLYLLLYDLSRKPRFALTGVLFVALSPWFWYLGFQNRPYPIVFLALVLFLTAWNTLDGEPPASLRLVASGACILAAILLHEAVVVVVPAAVIVLWFCGSESVRLRLARGTIWGGSIALCVLFVYFAAWRMLFADSPFLTWASGYLSEIHPLEAPATGPLTLFAKSVIGLSGALVQSGPIQEALSDFPAKAVLAVYGALGVAALAAITFAVVHSSAGKEIVRLIRTNALFAVSALSMAFWAAFVIAWEPVTPNFWVLILFPALACLALLLRGRQAGRLGAGAAAAVLIVSAWNAWQNYEFDRAQSRNFPEPILASINSHLGARGTFFVLGRGWYGDMNYDLILGCLDHTAQKDHGVAILDDIVFPVNGSPSWRRALSDRIDSTISAGGRVYVAGHVLDPDSYKDLCGYNDPFNAYIDPKCIASDTHDLFRQIIDTLAPYDQSESEFSIGEDTYYLLTRKETAPQPPAHDP